MYSPGKVGLCLALVGVAFVMTKPLWRKLPPLHSEDFHAILHDELNFTADQRRAIHELEEDFAKTRKNLQKQIADAEKTLGFAVLRGQSNVGALSTRLNELKTQAHVEMVSHFTELSEHMDRDQQRKFWLLSEAALSKHPESRPD